MILTLDTLARAGPGNAKTGRDLLLWGANKDYQLGNGKRASAATPATLELPGLSVGPKVPSEPGKDLGRLMMMQRKARVVQD